MFPFAIRKGVPLFAALAAASLASASAARQDDGAPRKQDNQVRRTESLKKIRGILDQWGSASWNDILAEDVRLTLKTTDVDRSEGGAFAMVSFTHRVQGKEAVTKTLGHLNQNLRTETRIGTEMISGNEAILLGDVTVLGKKDGKTPAAAEGKKAPKPSADPGRDGEEKKDKPAQAGPQGDRTPSMPLAIHLHFNESDQVDRMVIAASHLRPMPEEDGSPEKANPQKEQPRK